ncbi:glycosyltransferase family 39 protein [bacterium SCSIO 12741]|nr:glycosyltransferase family 39 protein [bacterium SCSIO 12741]
MQNRLLHILPYLLLALLLAVPFFGHLDTLCFRTWDESRLAMNAFEMAEHGNPFVTHYKGAPDMWNTKPPLMIWLQVFWIKVIGANEIATRLPSILASLFTCVLLLLFSHRYLKKPWFGFIAVMVLMTSYGYVIDHGIRFGEYDSLLALFTTIYCLSFYLWHEKAKPFYLYVFFVGLTLAVLSKSIAGLFLLPGLFLYTLWNRKLLVLLRQKGLYIGLLGFLIAVAGFYLIRESQNPGYLLAVWKNELGGRYNTVIEGHQGEFDLYYNYLQDYGFQHWFVVIPVGAIIGWVHRHARFNRLATFSSLLVLSFILILSLAETKIRWYLIPIYPFLSLLVAIAIYHLFDLLKESRKLRYQVLPFMGLFVIFATPYQTLWDQTYIPKDKGFDAVYYETNYLLRDALRGKADLDGYYVLYDGYRADTECYFFMLNQKGVQVEFKDWKKLAFGDRVIVQQPKLKTYLDEHYHYQILSQSKHLLTAKIYGQKNQHPDA